MALLTAAHPCLKWRLLESASLVWLEADVQVFLANAPAVVDFPHSNANPPPGAVWKSLGG
jgi:hypothetical protein